MQPVTTGLLLKLALPAALSILLNNAFRVIDQFSVQWLGVAAQAAVGSCTFVLIGFFSIYAMISSGTGPLVARATGAGDTALRRKVMGNAIVGASLLGLMVLVSTGLGASWIASTLGLSGETHSQAAAYLRWLALFAVPLAIAPVIDAAFIAVGRTTLVMKLQALATVLNILLNPICIYALNLGIAGAAIATGISRSVTIIIGLVMIGRLLQPKRSDFRPDRTLLRIIRIGLPISSNNVLFAAVYWALLKWAISPLGPAVNAALGIGFSALEGFTWPVYWGFSLAVASLVGRYLGAGQPEQAVKTIRLAFPVCTVAGVAISAVFWFGAAPLCSLFTDDAEVLKEAIQYAQILAFSQLFLAYEALAEGTLEGAGDTKTVLLWSAPINLLRVPLGWACAIPLGYGAAGIWWVINLTTLLKAGGKSLAVIRGRWKSVRV